MTLHLVWILNPNKRGEILQKYFSWGSRTDSDDSINSPPMWDLIDRNCLLMNDSSSSTPHSIFIDVLYICVNPTIPKSSEKVGTTDITGAVLSTRKPLDEDSLHSPIIKKMTVSLIDIMHRLVISFFPINEIDDGKINLPIA